MSPIRSKSLILVCWAILATTSAGCAFGDRRATLKYQPGEATKGLAAAPGSRGTITLHRFADQRGDRSGVGEVRNGYGIKTASVLAQNDVAQWVSDAIRAELEYAGYRVIDSTSAGTSVSGDVITVYCTALFSYEAEVSFFARVRRGGVEVINKRYTGKASGGMNWAATDTGYAWSLELALRNAVGQLLGDLIGAAPAKSSA